MATTTPGRRTSIGVIGAGMAMVAFSALGSQPASATDNPTTYSSNIKCADLGLDGVKIDSQPANGTYSGSDFVVEDSALVAGAVPSDLEIEISNVVAGATVTFDWHASTDDGDFPIDVVLVKFADGGLKWAYAQPGESSDSAWSTKDSISHVSFCFDGNTGSTDSTDATDTDSTDTDSTDTDSTDTDSTDTDSTDTDSTDTDSTDTDSTDTDSTDTDSTDTDSTDTGNVLGTGGTDTGGSTGGSTGNNVLGNTVTRPAAQADTLPATGSSDLSLTIAGSTLVALGAAGLATSSWLRRSKGAHQA